MRAPAKTNGNTAAELDDLQAFPVLAETISSTGVSAPTGSGSGGLGQLVQNNLREVLAWRPRATDPKGFVAALNQAFSITEVDGHTEWKWTPRSYAIQADMGAVTGAQASIYARAKNALDQSLPLLDGLYPLRADADKEDTEAARALVRSTLTELVSELGQVGGPRLQRVDAHFTALLGMPADLQSADRQDPEQVSGLLGKLRLRFGMSREQINTIDEEQNLTNFLILADHVIALQLSWNNQRHFFDRRGRDVFLGTQLVLLSRALGVMAESVKEAYFAMDSVFLGAAERQTTRLNLGGGQFRLTIAELLGWIETVSTDEGPRMISDAGKDGVVALRPTLDQLSGLMNDAVRLALQPDGVAVGYHTARVRRALQGVQKAVAEAQRLAGQIQRDPGVVVRAVQPDHAPQGTLARVSIEGAGFQAETTVHLNRSGPSNERIEGQQAQFISANKLFVTFDLRGAALGPWTIVASNPDQSMSTLRHAFVVEVPEIDEIELTVQNVTPSPGLQGERLDVMITGVGFERGATSDFGRDITVIDTTFLSDTSLQASIAIARNAVPGARNVSVTNFDGETATLAGGFAVAAQLAPAPELFDIVPESGRQGETHTVVVSARNIQPDATIDFGSGITVTNFRPEGRRWRATIAIDSATAPGMRTVFIVNKLDGQQAQLDNGFEVLPGAIVTPPPTITSVQPTSGEQGQTPTVTITGANFQQNAESDFGAGITAKTSFVSDQELRADLLIEKSADIGSRIVTVKNPDGQTAPLANAFEVTSPPIIEIARPVVEAIEPPVGARSQTLDEVHIHGQGFKPGATVSLGQQIRDVEAEFVDETHLIIRKLPLRSNLKTGLVDVTVNNPGRGSTGAKPQAFDIQ